MRGHEFIALLVGGAVGGGNAASNAKKRLEHFASPAVSALVLLGFLPGIEHRLTNRRISLGVGQAHISKAVFGHQCIVQKILVLRLVDRNGAFPACKVT